jgi:hypothetical protein
MSTRDAAGALSLSADEATAVAQAAAFAAALPPGWDQPYRALATVAQTGTVFGYCRCRPGRAAVAADDRLSAVPLVLASELTLVAVLDLPRMKEPPVAATAVPDIAKNSAISEITIAGDGPPPADTLPLAALTT